MNKLDRRTQTNLLGKRGEFTKFQMLLEIMKNQPYVRQKDISEVLGISIQAVSKYFQKLMREGYLEAGSERANYRLTHKAIEKLSEDLENLERYVKGIRNALKIESAWTAIATQPIKKGDKVGLIIREGVLYTVVPKHPEAEAFGIAAMDAGPEEDVRLKNLKGNVKIKLGKILLIKLPSIREGGSRAVDLAKIQKLHEEFKPHRIGVIGTEAIAVMKKLGLNANSELVQACAHATTHAAFRGLNVLVLVVGRMVNQMIEEIDQINIYHNVNIMYEVKDARTPRKSQDSYINILNATI